MQTSVLILEVGRYLSQNNPFLALYKQDIVNIMSVFYAKSWVKGLNEVKKFLLTVDLDHNMPYSQS